jgi:hypothetical protein
MTSYAVVVYYRETRWALQQALGRPVTNKEQREFCNRLNVIEKQGWISDEAKKEAVRINGVKNA